RGEPASRAPTGHKERAGGERRKRRPTKAHLRVATLNMRGYRTAGDPNMEGKWLQVNQVLREKRIAVLALQETHLSAERVKMLNDLFKENMEVVYSADPENETGARGVAFAINKRFVKQPKYTTIEVVPGRAAVLDLKWSDSRQLRMLNVYGPNDPHQNAKFWSDLRECEQTRNVDMVLGDLNVVTSPMDRIPERSDGEEPVRELDTFIESRNLVDGWRLTNAHKRAYTYLQRSTGSQSRIDRVYARRDILQDADNWDILEPGLITDHRLALVDIADRKAPFTGKGRWVMPKHLLTDEKMKKKMREIGAQLVAEIGRIGVRTANENPQKAYATFKERLVLAARQRAKEKVPRMQKQIERLREDVQRTLNTDATTNRKEAAPSLDADRIQHAAILQDRLDRLEQKRFETARRCVAARHKIQDEMMTKRWARSAGTT
ncbi:DNase I-like protein, partial [Cubamyces sp. BRFM 1775]